VTTTDLNGNQIFPDTLNTANPNVTTITWVDAQAGRALVCHAASISIATNQPNAILQNPTGSQQIVGLFPFNVSAPTSFSGNFSVSGPTAFSGTGTTGTLTAGTGILNTANIFTQPQTAPAWVSSTANVAQSGAFRMAAGDTLSSRDTTDSFDVPLIQLNPAFFVAPTITLGGNTYNRVEVGLAIVDGNNDPGLFTVVQPIVGVGHSISIVATNGGGFPVAAGGGNVNLVPGTAVNGGSNGVVRIAGITVASKLPACNSSSEGSLMPVSDSSVSTWGAQIAGSGTSHVLAYCDGSQWTVAAI
jgi:hypothetical protein